MAHFYRALTLTRPQRLRPISFVLSLFVMLTLACTSKTPPQMSAFAPTLPNVRSFSTPYARVWTELLDLLTYELLFSLDVTNANRGHFSSAEVRENRLGQPIKSRLSGTVFTDGQTTTVTLYRHQQHWDGSKWRARLSNGRMENEVLTRLAQRLENESN